uniref:C2H2-type domain-containing protein n=1 Tax=Ditylenchus dipsaci TaxID=166011 RepID=A0A915CRK2_9BILA
MPRMEHEHAIAKSAEQLEDERRSIDPELNKKLTSLFPGGCCPYDGCKKAVIKHSKNLYRHMKNKHNSELEKVILEIDKAKTRLPFDVISTTNRPLRYLTMYAGTSTFAFAHLENPWLLRLLGTCKGMTCIPNRRALRTLVGGELKKVQNKLKIICENVTHGLSVCVDIATTRGMATSFLAICVQFITPAGIKNYPLDVICNIPGHHTGSAISEKTLGKLGDVGNPNVHRFVTDGASNMRVAFM